MNHVSKKFVVTLLALALCAGGAWAAEGGSASPDGTLLLRGEEVYRVVNGITKAKRGKGHKIAVELGLKPAA